MKVLWKKVEGRFKPTSINIKYDQCLSLIGHIIPKTGQWKNFKAKFDIVNGKSKILEAEVKRYIAVQGQTEGTVSVIHIVTDGTVDERILKALEAKDLTQSALIDAVKAEVGDGK